jgi:hypothetical protein
LSADTIIDGGYQSPIGLNRYAFSRNNPLKYTDPTGHFVVNIGAAIAGALIGGGIDLGYQMIAEGKSLEQINWGSVAGSSAAGAITGATLGLGSGIVGVGAVAFSSGVIGGQVGAVIEGTTNEVIRSTQTGDGLNIANAYVKSRVAGLMEPSNAIADGVSNVIGTGFSKVASKVLTTGADKITQPARKPIAVFEPNPKSVGGWYVKEHLGYTRTPTHGEVFIQQWGRWGAERSSDILSEDLNRRVNPKIEQRFDEWERR